MSGVYGFNALGPQQGLLGESAAGGCGSCGQNGGAKKRKTKKTGSKPLTAYQKFVKKEFKPITDAHPKKSATDIIKMVAQKWRASKK